MESFAFGVRGGALPTSGDPYTGKAVTVTINGTLRFSGECLAPAAPEYAEHVGWVRMYQCLGLRCLGDWVRHTDSNNGSDRSSYNMSADNQGSEYIAARAGRTIGQILTDVLTMTVNANALNAYGIGGYTGLPSAPGGDRRGPRGAELDSAGIASRDAAGQVVDFHAIRYSEVTNFIKSGADVKTVQIRARHSNPALTIGRYAHTDDDRKRKALEKMGDGEEGKGNA